MYCTNQKARRLPKASSENLECVVTNVIYEPRKNNTPSIISADTETCPHNGQAEMCGVFCDTEFLVLGLYSAECWVYGWNAKNLEVIVD